MSCTCATSPKYLWVLTIIHHYKTVLISVSPTHLLLSDFVQDSIMSCSHRFCGPKRTLGPDQAAVHGMAGFQPTWTERVATAWRKGVKGAAMQLLLGQNVPSDWCFRHQSGPKCLMDSFTSNFEWYTLLLGACGVCMFMFMSYLKSVHRTWFANDISLGWCHDLSCLTSNIFVPCLTYYTVL